ncbi:MAG: peroxiredoxin family protein [Proteobacteria bacterium]|nr:peroxiredoxin family protein [Pseudomonadota bacterium]
MRPLPLLLALALIALLSAAAVADEPSRAYPEAVLQDHAGQGLSLAEAAGAQRLVVVVMKRSSCPVCAGQMTRLSELRDTLVGLDARVVGVMHDRPTPTQPPTLPAWPVLADPSRQVLQSLQLWREAEQEAMPTLIVFDRCGAERFRQTGRWGGARPESELMLLLKQMQEAPASCGEV